MAPCRFTVLFGCLGWWDGLIIVMNRYVCIANEALICAFFRRYSCECSVLSIWCRFGHLLLVRWRWEGVGDECGGDGGLGGVDLCVWPNIYLKI